MNDPIDSSASEGEQICWQCGATYGPDQEYCVEDGSELVEVNPSETQDMLVGHIFDERFRVISKLGEGGMSRVYQARRVKGGDEVALKILKADFLQNTEIRKRFMYEARVISNLDHPNAVELFDFGQSPDGSFYMVMERLKGESLSDRLDNSFLRYRTIFEYLAPICGVLHQAHQQDIVHRDLKPENIYLKREAEDTFRPKLLDFGIAKHLRSRTMTQDDAMWGTPAYMSPEQASDDTVTAASDIYAMGVILYELVAGVLPLRASTSMGFAVKHMQSDVRPLKELPGIRDLPEDLNQLILAMLEKDPADRPDSMLEVEEELSRIVDEELFPHQFDAVPAEQVDHDQLVTPEQEEGTEAGKESGRLEMDEELMDAKTQALDGGQVREAAAETPTDLGGPRETVTGADTVEWETWTSRLGDYRVGAVAAILMLAVGLVGGAYWMFEVRGANEPSASSGPSAASAVDSKPTSGTAVGVDTGLGDREAEDEGNAASVGRAATYGADVLMRARDVANAIESNRDRKSRQADPRERNQRQRRRRRRRNDPEPSKETANSSKDSTKEETAPSKQKEDEEIEKALETTF